MIKKTLPGILLILISGVFFWKVILKGLVPFPGDLLVGAYFPWYEYQWGYVAGVPVKNPLISDVFSQQYPWKLLAVDSYRQGQWPLWNPYVYSGYPMLAAFSGGVLYPLNLLMLLGAAGWSAMIIFQVVGAGLFTYWFLVLTKHRPPAALAGALAFGLSSAMIVRLEFNSAGQVMVWLAALLVVIELYFEKSRRVIVVLPAVIFLLVTAGHFQTMFYSLALAGVYTVRKLVVSRDYRRLGELGLFAAAGMALSAVQLLPTHAMLGESVRFAEDAAARDNFGLLPISNLVAVFAPDFFGNPVTGNYWGILNYNETIFYPGMLGVIALLWALVAFRKLDGWTRFFLGTALSSMLIAFDNPVGRLVYDLKIPFISTGSAARINVVFVFATAMLAARWLDNFRRLKWREALWPFLLLGGLSVFSFALAQAVKSIGLAEGAAGEWYDRQIVLQRNLVWPSLLLTGLFCLTVVRRLRIAAMLVVLVVVADVFRFGWKYTPFVPAAWVYPETGVMTFLKNQPDYFRVESQKGPILPANTWSAYGLFSVAGYDPLAPEDYVAAFSRRLMKSEAKTRYSILDRYESADLGEFNVKYLLALKDTSGLYRPDMKPWQRVYETDRMIVFENPAVKPRAEWQGEGAGTVEITRYTPNIVDLAYRADSPGRVVLRDAWAAGWRAVVGGENRQVDKYDDIFRQIAVPAGEGVVKLTYEPVEWRLGGRLTLVGLAGWLLLVLVKFFPSRAGQKLRRFSVQARR